MAKYLELVCINNWIRNLFREKWPIYLNLFMRIPFTFFSSIRCWIEEGHDTNVNDNVTNDNIKALIRPHRKNFNEKMNMKIIDCRSIIRILDIEFKTCDAIRIPLFEFSLISRHHNVVSQSNDIENQYNHFIEFQVCGWNDNIALSSK